VAMNTGTQAAKEAGNLVTRFEPDQAHPDRRDRQTAPDDQGDAHDLQHRERCGEILRHSSGSVHLDLPGAWRAHIMGLATPQSAVLSAVIFNALIIIFLVPLALRGVKYRRLERRWSCEQRPDLRRRRSGRSVHRDQLVDMLITAFHLVETEKAMATMIRNALMSLLLFIILTGSSTRWLSREWHRRSFRIRRMEVSL